MTTAQVAETSVTVNNNSPIQDYVHPDDQTQPFEMTPGFKPFTAVQMCCVKMCCKSRRSKSIEIDIGNQSISVDLIRRLISEIDRNRSQKKIIYRLLSIFVIVNDNKRSSNPEVNILNMTIFDFSNYTRSPQLVQILVSFVSWCPFHCILQSR